MQIETVRFGQVEVDEKKIINFADGLPGLEDRKSFAILQFEEGNPIFWLQCTTAQDICLPVVDSFAVNPDYAFNISDDDVDELGIQGPEDLYILSVLVIPEDIQGMTMNLAAPVVVNVRTGKAKQVILGGGEYSVRMPVFARLCNMIKEGEADAGAVEKNK